MKRILAATAVLIAAALLLSACGSSSSASTSTAAASAAAGSGRRTALAACLKQHGVTLPARPAGAGGAGGGGPAPYGAGAPPAGAGGAPPTGGRRPGAGGGFFGGGGFGAPRSAKFRAALKACGANFPARRRAAFNRTTLTKFVACVRAHGYKLPAPNTSGNGPVFPAGIRTNPKFVRASRSCASLLARPAGAAPTASG